jgi:hypothetical protein
MWGFLRGWLFVVVMFMEGWFDGYLLDVPRFANFVKENLALDFGDKYAVYDGILCGVSTELTRGS